MKVGKANNVKVTRNIFLGEIWFEKLDKPLDYFKCIGVILNYFLLTW